MFLVVYNLNSRDRTLAKQLRFNHVVIIAKNSEHVSSKMGGFDNVCVSIVLRNNDAL